jgi:hypothetical protein
VKGAISPPLNMAPSSMPNCMSSNTPVTQRIGIGLIVSSTKPGCCSSSVKQTLTDAGTEAAASSQAASPCGTDVEPDGDP